jgi:hypothetical protein
MSLFRLICLAIILLVLYGMSGPTTSWLIKTGIQKLEEDYNVIYSENDIIILKDKSFGYEKSFKISSSHLALNPTMQVIDFLSADTADYSNYFTLTDTIIVSGIRGAYPLVIGDVDHDGNLDFFGVYKVESNHELIDCGIVELQSTGKFELQKVYYDHVTTPIAITDLDYDGLNELLFRMEYGDSLVNYESKSPGSYPDSINFTHPVNRGEICHDTIIDLDLDGTMDLLSKSRDEEGKKMFVAEYDIGLNRFIERWNYRFENPYHYGISYGDYDNDSQLEFVTSNIDGEVFIFENIDNDRYTLISKDSIPSDNAYLNCTTNDIDGNGKIEFFIGGTGYYNDMPGCPVYWFEAIGDNQYEKKYSFFLQGVGGLGITELYNYDINADGIDDLVFCFSYSVVILIWNKLGYFDLVFYSLPGLNESSYKSVNVHDIYGSGSPSLIFGVKNSEEREPSRFSKVYHNKLISHIEPVTPIFIPSSVHLYQNYPNPFNNTTKIRFEISNPQRVSLKIYDMTGKEVISLVNELSLVPGDHEYTWDGRRSSGKEVGSGIYIVSLIVDNYNCSRKIVLIK